jgi:Protein of unknown function (DUF998)
VTRLFATVPPAIAVLLALAAQSVTPGSDPVSRTVSRLAVPGSPAALLVDMAIGLVAFTCFALASGLVRGRRAGRISLVIAGIALACAALIHLDPASVTATWAHRAATGVAMAGLTAAPLLLARDYGAMCLVAGAAEVAMLALGAALLATPFDAWGLWERALLAIPLTWMVLIALTKVSPDEAASTNNPILSRSGSAVPASSVSSANP